MTKDERRRTKSILVVGLSSLVIRHRTGSNDDMSDKLRVVQVGCGGGALPHIAALLAAGADELGALCDGDEQRLHATGEKFGIARRYRDMAEAIRDEQPELVDIVTPPTIRAAIVEPAIAAGAPALLIEKPLALTPSESRRLAELGRDRLIA